MLVFCTTIVEILDFSKTSLTSRDCNFTKIWSLRISKYTRHIYSSRSLHFWCLIHATPSSIPSKPTIRTHENRNFRFWRCGAQPLSELSGSKNRFPPGAPQRNLEKKKLFFCEGPSAKIATSCFLGSLFFRVPTSEGLRDETVQLNAQ